MFFKKNVALVRLDKKYSKKGIQILLAGDLDLIEKGELNTLQKDFAEIERMLKALIKSLENKPLNPGPDRLTLLYCQ